MASRSRRPTRGVAEATETDEIVDTVRSLEEHDLVIINGDERTYRVTDVVEQSSDGSGAVRKVIRLESPSETTLAIELEEEAVRLHVLRDSIHDDVAGEYPLTSIQVIDDFLEWVVYSGHENVYHRPDPLAALKGEASPVCKDFPTTEFRMKRLVNLHDGQKACANCFRHADLHVFPELECPECGHTFGRALLTGGQLTPVEGVVIDCPECSFEGSVDLPASLTSVPPENRRNL